MEEFDAVFREYAPFVYHYLLSLSADPHLAEELTAETLYQAYLHIERFRGDCKPGTWLCQIAKNALIKERRRQRRFSPQDETAASEGDLLSDIADRERAMLLHRHLHSLREPYKEVFMLRVFSELGFRDIANLFNKSESWAKVTFYRAKDMLIREMEANHEI